MKTFLERVEEAVKVLEDLNTSYIVVIDKGGNNLNEHLLHVCGRNRVTNWESVDVSFADAMVEVVTDYVDEGGMLEGDEELKEE